MIEVPKTSALSFKYVFILYKKKPLLLLWIKKGRQGGREKERMWGGRKREIKQEKWIFI